MHLLNTTSLQLEYFMGNDIPSYAILSHRWEDEEILFEDVQTDQWPRRNRKKGVDKVKGACIRARGDNFEYIWIDTCCIAYPHITNCGCKGDGSYQTFRQLLSSFSVATRMSWASDRVTTRVEDQAYSLLGLFDVNMPLLYGEGTKAFLRLQEEIVRISNDQSILAGHHRPFVSNSFVDMGDRFGNLFPTHPRAFQHTANLERPSASSKYLSMALTNRCLNIDLLVCPCWWQHDMDGGITRGWLGILACVYSDDSLSRPAILLDRLSGTGNDQHVFTRTQIGDGSLIMLSPGALSNSSGDVEISEGKLLVGLDPSRIEMMNVDLLLYSPRQTQATTRAPAIRINPTIGGHDGVAYWIRTSLPELEDTPNGRARDVRLTLKDQEGKIDVMRGLLAIDDESGHGFFVAYGFTVCDGSYPEEVDYVTPPAFVPWCRLLTLDEVAPKREWMSDVTHEDMVDFTRLNNDARIRFDDPRVYRGELLYTAQLHDSMDWTGKRGFRAQVAMTPKTFLGQTAYELEISVWRLVHREPKIHDMVDDISYMSLSRR
ncbi:hypothetical protein CEP52_002235 [Fusarium oligoseptatum]|uniref:Heterokaryon incompatibility domain-containing protein n=1 Tax=Fusarium oligoseptatum TaxID=2604345 RepID=A0A428UEX1_9HYPO|nr:hypothetical protein CEP52_002235 [Fusarium oligoseptatum]